MTISQGTSSSLSSTESVLFPKDGIHNETTGGVEKGKDETGDVIRIQLRNKCWPERDVSRTVRAQFLLAHNRQH